MLNYEDKFERIDDTHQKGFKPFHRAQFRLDKSAEFDQVILIECKRMIHFDYEIKDGYVMGDRWIKLTSKGKVTQIVLEENTNTVIVIRM